MNTRIKSILIIALLAVSTSAIIARFLPGVSATVISLWRMLFASAAVWLYSLFKSQDRINKRYLYLFILAGIFLGLHFTCFYQAVKLTSIANATLLGITAPMFTFVFERFILKKKFSKIIFFGFTMALVGVFIITGFKVTLVESSKTGNIFGLGAALCIAAVYLLTNKIRVDTSTISYTRILYLVAAIFLFAVTIVGGEEFIRLSKTDFLWLFILGLVPTILGHSLFYYGIKFTSPTIIASIPLGEPIIASVLAWIIFFETIPLITLSGGALMLLGVYVIVVNSPLSQLGENY